MAGTTNRARYEDEPAFYASARRAAQLLGGEVAGANHVLCPGPGHSAKDRSLSVSLFGGAFVVHSFAGDDWQECRDHVKALLGLQDEPKRRATIRQGHRPEGLDDTCKSALLRSDATPSRRALDLWHEAGPLAGSPGAIHLGRRGVAYEGEALRWHPSCPFGRERVGCMVALVRNIETNEPQAIHRTAIDAQGRKLSTLGNNGRLSLGPTKGGAVKLTDDADVERVIAIGEGIETTLSIRRLPDLENMPVWSVLSAGGVRSFPALQGIESVWIAADHDASEAGQMAAYALAQRLDAAGIEPVVILPRAAGTDLNDREAAYV